MGRFTPHPSLSLSLSLLFLLFLCRAQLGATSGFLYASTRNKRFRTQQFGEMAGVHRSRTFTLLSLSNPRARFSIQERRLVAE